MNKNMIKFISFGLLTATLNSYAFSPGNFMDDLLTSQAGSKAVDNSEGKNLDKFYKQDDCKLNYPWGAPRLKDIEINKRSLFICKEFYAIQFDPKVKIPLWSTEVLKRSNLETKPFKNKFKLKPDNELPNSIQMSPDDFINTPYLPISLASTKDMVIYNDFDIPDVLEKRNFKIIEESQLFSNLVPMVYNNLANTIWSELENKIISLTLEKETVLVNSGVIYLNGEYKGTLKSGAVIPTHFYKTVSYPGTYGSATYIVPNKEIMTGKKLDDPKNAYYCNNGPCTLSNFLVKIQDLEKFTGIEFYPKLPPYYASRVKLDVNEMFKEKRNKIEKQNSQ